MGGAHDAAHFSCSLWAVADYIQLNYSNFDTSEAVQKMKATTTCIPSPPQPTADAKGATTPVSEVDFYLWKWDHSKAQHQKDACDSDMKKTYTLVFHQWSHMLTTELEADDSFDKIQSMQDVISLLGLIKSFCSSFDTKMQGVMATVEAMKRSYVFFQKHWVNNQT